MSKLNAKRAELKEVRSKPTVSLNYSFIFVSLSGVGQATATE